MAKRKRNKIFYNYECSITGESFRVTTETKDPGELMSVKAYYQLNPEEDDRPEVVILKERHADGPKAPMANSLWTELVKLTNAQKEARAAEEARISALSQS